MTGQDKDENASGNQLENIMASLRRLDAQYKETHEGLDALADESIRAGENIAEVIGVMSQLFQEVRATHKPLVDELNNALRGICALYLDAGDDLRTSIRDAFDRQSMLRWHLMNLTGTACLEIPRGDAEYWLRTALAAVSIEDNRTDFRDTYISLGSLYLAAARAGLEPMQHFRDVAALSSDKMKTFLENFNKSAFYASSVAPSL